MTVGERIKHLRQGHGLTLEYVGARIGVTKATVQKYENGAISGIPSDKIELLAVVLCATPAYLMGWESEDEEALDIQSCTTNDIAAKIKTLRQQHHLTLEQVAQTVGVTKSTVRKWETGQIASMRQDKVVALSHALHTTPAFLMGLNKQDMQQETESSFCDRIREYRQQSGETLESLARRVEIPVQTLNRYELKQRTPKVDIVVDIAKNYVSARYGCWGIMSLLTER